MTPKEKQVYTYIVRYREKHGYSPTARQIARGKVTRQAVDCIIKMLIKKGHLKPIKPIKQGWFVPVDNLASGK